MKETQQTNSDKTEIVKQQEKKTSIQYLGSLRPKKGHKLFEVNAKTGEISLAKYEKNDASYTVAMKGDFRSGRKSVIIKPDCLYISALNKKNVIKKLGINQ